MEALAQIPSIKLRLTDIPSSGAAVEEIERFALTFDGYEHWGSFDQCALIANEQRHDTLTNLRTCLFFEQRRWRHFGEAPDAEAEAYWRTLVDKIRARVQAGDLR